MPRQTIIWVDDGKDRFLAYRDEWNPEGIEATEVLLEELADFCDHGAENCNAHEYVGAHRLLATVLFRHVGRCIATKILRDIAEMGGLDAMNGVCEKTNSYSELGIPECWKDWALKEV